MLHRFLLALLLTLSTVAAADLRVAVLHPLLGDMVREIGGNHVEVVDLIGPKGDPHHFEPTPENLKQAENCQLYLAAGMGLEGYLPKLRGVLAGRARIVEIGASLPALEGACEDHDHAGHHHHTLDPHWWHSIQLFSRATQTVADALIAESPQHTEAFLRNTAAYRARLDELEKWTRRQIARIPRQNRQLATAHAAFNYFCKDFGFTPIPVQGVNREQSPDPQQLAKLVQTLKSHKVLAIFPEQESNPKILQTLTQDTGIRLGQPLIADGTGGKTYEEMVKQNVTNIVDALSDR
ncbi:MAG: metal ABC transporter substrate-binding protein [Luteolibacter sp.]